MAVTTRGITPNKPASSMQLAAFFDSQPTLDGYMYVGYPIGTPEGTYVFDGIWLSPTKGIVLINLIEGRSSENYAEIQDDYFNKLRAKLTSHKNLVAGRTEKFVINTVTFAPAIPQQIDNSINPLINNEESLLNWLKSLKGWEQATSFNDVVEAVQSIGSIRKKTSRRDVFKQDSRGSKLKRLEESISNLDSTQAPAVIETVDGVQRIRGLAGSGKTIVLALKAAYLHAIHPDWKIGVTFHTRALKGQFKRLINTFVVDKTGEEPNWENLHIVHAWGSAGPIETSGMYYSFCQIHGVEALDFRSAQAKFGKEREFEGACESALGSSKESHPFYDAILVDEAQDFSPAFLRLCYEFLKEKKRLVYAYDELQSLSNNSLPPPEQIFGVAADGNPKVKFAAPRPGAPKQDIILERCYRNSRPVLATAHALGFGIYRKPQGLIQMFEQSSLWEDIGYSVAEGSLVDGNRVVLERRENSSPVFLENHSNIDDLIFFESFSSNEEQVQWLVNSILENINNDELRPDDIIVINPDPLKTRDAVSLARKMLFDRGIRTHLAGVDTSPDVFFDGDSVTFTGIFRAKGNEAGMVYVINAHDCYSSFGSLARVRNRLFTAITRSKAWVRVSGIGENFQKLREEFLEIKNNDFKLDFIYPTAEERKKLNIVNRDMSDQERERLRKSKGNLNNLLEELESGNLFIDDLPDEQIARLQKLLSGKGE